MDDLEPAEFGFRVMDDKAFEITKATMRKKVDDFLKEKGLTPTGQERATLYRVNYYHMLFWMMAQPVADPVEQEPEEPHAKVLFSINIPEWVTSWETRMWVFVTAVGLGCLLLGYIIGRP